MPRSTHLSVGTPCYPWAMNRLACRLFSIFPAMPRATMVWLRLRAYAHALANITETHSADGLIRYTNAWPTMDDSKEGFG